MTSRKKGILIGLFAGTIAASIAYLSLSESSKKQLAKETSDKIDELNDTIMTISERIFETVTDKVEDSQEMIEECSEQAGDTIGEGVEKAKGLVSSYAQSASKTLDDKLNYFKNRGDKV
ncbi:hypothetical protein [Streptococcus catagoni]|uniref:hypothetical protein n=1 Tax=Streptococcus catagoni TaxID=2654874 RepID=UPI00140BF4FE|nr:hypothetical protein [Streptococcus catagoni]